MAFDVGPAAECSDCPRLAAFRASNRAEYPDWSNAPVASFGAAEARLLIVGLAPGLRGANRTGRPFTGDHAGELLYRTLIEFGFASGSMTAARMTGSSSSTAQSSTPCAAFRRRTSRPLREIATCRRYLTQAISALPRLRIMLALGRIAHESALRAINLGPAKFPFAHGARHSLAPSSLILFDSYHCSRYNTNTGVLTEAMFRQVFASIRAELDHMDVQAPVLS